MFWDFIIDWIGLKYFDGILYVSILIYDFGVCLMIWWMRYLVRCEFWMFMDMWLVFVRFFIWVGVSICFNFWLNRLFIFVIRGGVKVLVLYIFIEVDYVGV